MTKLINIRDNPNWRKEGAVYIGRGSPFGNPFRFGRHRDREEAIESYGEYFHRKLRFDKEFLKEVNGLRDKTLACFCAPKPCHGQVIIDFLEDTHELQQKMDERGDTSDEQAASEE